LVFIIIIIIINYNIIYIDFLIVTGEKIELVVLIQIWTGGQKSKKEACHYTLIIVIRVTNMKSVVIIGTEKAMGIPVTMILIRCAAEIVTGRVTPLNFHMVLNSMTLKQIEAVLILINNILTTKLVMEVEVIEVIEVLDIGDLKDELLFICDPYLFDG